MRGAAADAAVSGPATIEIGKQDFALGLPEFAWQKVLQSRSKRRDIHRALPSPHDRLRFPIPRCSIYVLRSWIIFRTEDAMTGYSISFALFLILAEATMPIAALAAGKIFSPMTGRPLLDSAFELHEHHVPNMPRTRQPRSKRIKVDDSKAPFMPVNLARARTKFAPMIEEAERRHHLPHGLLDALIWTESAYRADAVSAAGAAGLTQLMPATAAELNIRNRFDANASIDGGARYLKAMLARFGTFPLALAAYNAGAANVEKHDGIPPFTETQKYVAKVLNRWSRIKQEHAPSDRAVTSSWRSETHPI